MLAGRSWDRASRMGGRQTAEAGCLVGKTLWLDVGLQYRGRASPPGEEEVGVGGPLDLYQLIKVAPFTMRLTVQKSLPSSPPSPLCNGTNLVASSVLYDTI